MIPPELLGLRPFHQSSSGTELSDFLVNRNKEQDQQELGLRQLAEQQQHNRAIESNQSGELDREKAKDALLAKNASAKLDKKLSADDTKLWNQYNVRAIQAEAVGDLGSATAYRNAMDALTAGAPGTTVADTDSAHAESHAGMAGPAFDHAAPSQESPPFVDMGGLQFASKGPSGAFRTSNPGATPPPVEPPPGASPAPSPQAAPTGAFGSGFDTSKVGAVNPDEVDSSAIAASMLGMPVHGKRGSKKHGKSVIELPDQEITAQDPNTQSLLDNPQDYGAPPQGPAGIGMGPTASAPSGEAKPSGKWVNAPGGRRMWQADASGAQQSDVASMWKTRLEMATSEPEKAAAQAALLTAQSSRSETEAKKTSEVAYRDTLAGFKKRGPGGGGTGGPAGPGEKSLVKDYDYILGTAKDAEGIAKAARQGIENSDRTIALITTGERTGFKDTDAIDSHLRAVTGSNRVPVQQLHMTTEAAGKWEAFMNLADQYVAGGKRTPEFMRQMLDAAKVAKQAAVEAQDRAVNGAASLVEQRASHLGRRPEDVKKEGAAVRVKITGESPDSEVSDDEYQKYRKARGFK